MGRELTGREPPALRTCDSRLLCPIETQSTAQTQPSSTALAHQGVPCYAARSLSGASSPGAVVLICITCLRPCHTISKKPPVPPGWSSAAGLAAPAEEGGELSQGFRLQRDGNQGTCMKLMEAESLPWLELHRCNQYVPAAGAPGGPQQDPIPQSAEGTSLPPRSGRAKPHGLPRRQASVFRGAAARAARYSQLAAVSVTGVLPGHRSERRTTFL